MKKQEFLLNNIYKFTSMCIYYNVSISANIFISEIKPQKKI
jgi:hypothetical protein